MRMRRRQALWFVTMISLISVLSVYYVTSPKEDLNLASKDTEVSEDTASTTTTESEDADPVFAQMRMDFGEERSQTKENLQSVVASTDLSEEERSSAYNEIQGLSAIESTENILQSKITALGYQDSLVHINDSSINVSVKGDEGVDTSTSANEIIHVVSDEIGASVPVSVEFKVPAAEK